MTARRTAPAGRRRASQAKFTPESGPFTPPYPPSWLDRVTAAVDRLPGPAWLTFVALATAGVLLQLLIQRSTGDYHPGPFLPLQIWLTGHFAYLLAMVYYLDRAAADALESFRPVLQLSPLDGDADYGAIRYRLTTLPARETAWVSVVGGLLFAAIPMLFIRGPAGGSLNLTRSMSGFGFSASPVAFSALMAHFVATQAIGAALVYHTIHQLRMINHIYVHHARVNLYRLQPLYAFSVLAALTAGGLMLYAYLWFGTTPALLNEPGSLVLGAFFGAIAIVTFTWPLWGIHRRLVEEKRRLLQASSTRFEATVAEVHQRVDRNRLTRMDDLNRTLASLEIEQAALRRVPTWPWEPGTLRNLLAAILLPVFLWLVQYFLQKLLG